MDKAQIRKKLKAIQRDVDAFNALYGGGNERTTLRLTTIADSRAEAIKAWEYSMQFNQDMMMIALHDKFGFAESRQKQYFEALNEIYFYFRKLLADCLKDDPEALEYWDKLERALKDACGKYFQPKEERYHMEIKLDGLLLDTMEYTDITDILGKPMIEKRRSE